MSLIDSAIRGAKKAALRTIRRAAKSVLGDYDAASRGRRTDGWTSPDSAGPNSEIYGQLSLIRARSRDLVRNNAYASHAKSVIGADTVGSGIRPSSPNSDLEEAVLAWATSKECDDDEKTNLWGLQRMIMGAIAQDGEALVIRRRRRLSSGLDIPMQLQVLEADYIADDLLADEKLDNGNRIVQGIEYSRFGRVVAYHLYKQHPGDSYEYWSAQDTRRVPAFDVAHVYWLDRPGQVRGVPWYAPVVIDMRDFDDYQDAQLLRQKVAACFTAFVRSPPSDFSLSDSKTDDAGRPLGEKVEPGMIEILQPGEEVTFGTPPQLQGEAEFASVSLHRIAAGLDISYEALTSDYSKVNFSSARMGWLQYQRQIKGWRHTMLEPMLLSTVGQWLIETATVMGLASPDDKIGWTYPGRQMIDPAKETKALAEQVRDGFKPWQDAVRELGEDPEEVIRKYQEDNERFDAAGLIFDLDPRRQNSNGTPRGSSNGQNQN